MYLNMLIPTLTMVTFNRYSVVVAVFKFVFVHGLTTKKIMAVILFNITLYMTAVNSKTVAPVSYLHFQIFSQ